MAGTKPTFITGANAKIRLNGRTLAFCQDFTCTVQVLTKTPKVLGKYEGDSVEPLGYMVSGSFSIVRYAKGIKEALGPGGFPHGLAANDAGNGVGNWGTAWSGSPGDTLSRNGWGSDGRAHEALDPSKFSAGTTFDIQVFQKIPVEMTSPSNPIQGITDILAGNADNIPLASSVDYLGVMNIRRARITQASFSINKRSPGVERFNFVALYVDGDGFVANASGI